MHRIRELLWREDRQEHMIERHEVFPAEVEEAVLYDPSGFLNRIGPARRDPRETVYEHYGRTSQGRYLMTALIYLSRGLAMPVTSREMDQKERRRYERG